MTEILKTANKPHNQNDVETSIQWIPGHCDIPGNNRADKLARQGTSKAQHDEHVSYATSKLIIQTKSRKIWHDRWARGNNGPTYTSTNKLQTRQTLSTSYTEHIRLPYFTSEHTMHHRTPTYSTSRENTKQTVSTAPTYASVLILHT